MKNNYATLDDLENLKIEILETIERREQKIVPRSSDYDPDVVLLEVLYSITSGGWFTAKEVFQTLEKEMNAACSIGDDKPAISTALEEVGVNNTHALSRWLGPLVNTGCVERGGREKDGVRWRIVFSKL